MLIKPDWPSVKNIIAGCTTRTGGVSLAPYDSFNLASHVGDNPLHVANNRSLLLQELHLPTPPCWLTQTHSTRAIHLNDYQQDMTADASFTDVPSQICVVLTADCLPILITDKNARCVAAIHAGWRGLADGIITTTITAMKTTAKDLYAWLGPAISQESFEVGPDVFNLFLEKGFNVSAHSKAIGPERWLLDLYGLARDNLQQCGITAIYGGDHCTYKESDLFFFLSP